MTIHTKFIIMICSIILLFILSPLVYATSTHQTIRVVQNTTLYSQILNNLRRQNINNLLRHMNNQCSSNQYDNDLLLPDQCSEPSKNKQYLNDGISVGYPLKWKVEEGTSKYNVVTFLAPSTNLLNRVPAAIAIYRHELPAEAKGLSDNDLFNLYTFAQIAYINKTFGLTSVKNGTLLGSNAYQIDFSNDDVYASCIWTVKNSYVFVIIYAANNETYPVYMSVFQQIMNSLRLDAGKFSTTR